MTSSKKRISNLIQQEVTKSDQLNITNAEAASTDANSSADTEKLQAELKQKDETIAKLEKEVAGLKKLEAELDEVKKDAVKLAQENKKLTQEKAALEEKVRQTVRNPQRRSLVVTDVVVHHNPQESPDNVDDFATNSWLL
jgi:septal ring factor EnvC (AmiA/AmiB activator)